MGLNIYFCDICAARVTDADLRSGHGLLQGDDAVCVTCIDLAAGRQWLADHRLSQPKPAIPVAQRVADPMPESPAVVTDFSSAAAGFAAMGTAQQPSDLVNAHLPETVPSESPSGTRPMVDRHASDIDDLPAAPYHPPETEDESSALIEVPQAVKAAVALGSTETTLPAPADRSVRGSDSSLRRPKGGKKDGSKDSSSANNRPSGKVSSKTTARAGRVTDGKAAGGGLPLQLKISLITLPIILAVAGVGFYLRGQTAGGGSKRAAVTEMSASERNLRQHFDDVKAAINAAVTSTSVEEKQRAVGRWAEFLDEWDRFAKDSIRGGWSEDNCSDYWTQLRAADVGARTKLLRDDIVRLSK